MYVGTWDEYLAGAADIDAMLEMAGPGSRAMLAQGVSAARAKGHQLDERVRAPIFDTEKGGMKVNGKPITGVAILDTGCMPFIIGEPGKKQLGLTDEDIIPKAVRLGLADGNATQLQGLTKRTIKLTFNLGTKWETSMAVSAVVTEAPYDFLIGNIILWSLGGMIDSWGWRGTPEFRYRLEWLAGPKLASRREGRVPLTYMRDPVVAQPEAQYCMQPAARALPARGKNAQRAQAEIEDKIEDGMPPLETESEAGSEESEPANLSPLDHEQYEHERGVGIASALAGQGGLDATPERVIVRRLDPYKGEGPDDSLAVMEMDPRGPMVVPPRYEVLRRLDPWKEMAELPILEQPTRARALRADRNRRLWEVNGRPLGSTPMRTLAEELDSVPADPQGWLRLPFGPTEAPASVQRRIERGLYRGPIHLYRAEALCTFAYTQVAARAGETPVAPAGYFILSESPRRVTEVAAELAAAVHGLTAAPPAEPNVPWEELPWAFMATVATAKGGPTGRPDHWASMDRRWDRNVAVEGQGPEEVRTRLPARVTILCLFGGLCSELEGWLRAGLQFGKVL
jgi:hypothetical protein